MVHTKHKIRIHGIIETKDGVKLLSPKIHKVVFAFIRNEFEELGCKLEAVCGTDDHVHVLFLHNPLKSISEVFKHVKGSVSHSINQADLTVEKFAWEYGYLALSIGESQVEKTVQYFNNQKDYHAKTSLNDELALFLKLYNIEAD